MGIFFNSTQPLKNSTNNNQAPNETPKVPEKVTSPLLGFSLIDTSKLHPMSGISADTLEYLTLEDGRNRSTAFGYIPSRSYSDDILYGTGTVYLTGLGLGGLYGAREGLKATKGFPFKIRFNGLLNGCTRRGPFLGNSLGMLALGYTSINSAAVYFGAPDTSTTAIASAALTGMLFKSTAGLRSSLIAGGICSLAVAVWKVANTAYFERHVDYAKQLAKA